MNSLPQKQAMMNYTYLEILINILILSLVMNISPIMMSFLLLSLLWDNF